MLKHECVGVDPLRVLIRLERLTMPDVSNVGNSIDSVLIMSDELQWHSLYDTVSRIHWLEDDWR